MLMDRVVYIVYHDLSTEARSFEMLCALKEAFKSVICVCRKPPLQNNICNFVYPHNSKNQYAEFIILAKKVIKQNQPEILVLHDEFTAPFISMGNKYNSFIVFDSSELNYKRSLPGIKNKLAKILYKIERRELKNVNLIFAANNERLEIMREKYNLSCRLEVFDNVHRIDDTFNESECISKYGDFFSKYKYPLVYGGGIAHGRFSFEIVKTFANMEDICILISGAANETCKKEFYNLISADKISNVYYLGFIPRSDFRYLLENAFASFVLFKADCPNTENCASGKMYESLFVGTPIICSENPPLKRICNIYGVGESSMDFLTSFQKIKNNRNVYLDNIDKYINYIDYNGRIKKLSNTIVEAYLNR